MKLTEIREDNKDRFVGNLKDPAAQEIADIANEFNRSASRGYSFNIYNAGKDLATFIVLPPEMGIETEEGNMIEHMKAVINNSQHWSFKSWRGDVENEFAVYVVRKAGV